MLGTCYLQASPIDDFSMTALYREPLTLDGFLSVIVFMKQLFFKLEMGLLKIFQDLLIRVRHSADYAPDMGIGCCSEI